MESRRKQRNKLNVGRKNRRKRVKAMLQAVLLLLLAGLLVQALFGRECYREPDKTAWTNRDGFVALSYFGVERSDSSAKLIGRRKLAEQLRALAAQGYTSVSQQDVIDFYQQGKPLPDKALFLSFEDGRNDSSLFAEPLLARYNLKATFLSYADKMGAGDHKFLQPKDMRKMMKTGYWELGTNGYRLTYINVFDREGQFVGVRDESKLKDARDIYYYNHYLMDFIRDRNMIPVEDRTAMEARIDGDYRQMAEIYGKTLGFVPSVYMIMHANSLHQGMNRLVADVNQANIEGLFPLHFNREGNLFNPASGDPLDLTRVQPAAYWSTNHLLMKLQQDTGQKVKFVRGDKTAWAGWSKLAGAAEFADNRITLTSPPAGSGLLYLNNSGGGRDIEVSALLSGNVVGSQAVYLRYDQEADAYIRVAVDNNVLIVEEKQAEAARQELFRQELSGIKWDGADLAYNQATVYSLERIKAGAAKEPYPVNISRTRKVNLALTGNQLRMDIDGKTIGKCTVSDSVAAGGVALEARYNVQNERDNIYDAVFDDVKVTARGEGGENGQTVGKAGAAGGSGAAGNGGDAGGSGDAGKSVAGEGKVLADHSLKGIEALRSNAWKAVQAGLDWMMDTF